MRGPFSRGPPQDPPDLCLHPAAAAGALHSLLPRVENTEYGVPYSPERRKFKAAATLSSLVSSMRRPGDTHDDAATVLGGKVGEGSVCAADKNALGEELDKISLE